MPAPRFDDGDFTVFTMGELATQILAMRVRVALTPAKLLLAFDALLPIYRRIGG